MKISQFFLILASFLLTSAEITANFTATGFKYCTHLSGSVFRSDVVIKKTESFPKFIAGSDIPRFVEILDKAAFRFYLKRRNLQLRDHLTGTKTNTIDPEELKRFACYWAADGANNFFSISEKPALLALDPTRYFPSKFGFAPSKTSSPFRAGDRKCKIGYMLLVHAEVEAVTRLINAIDHPEALIVVHWDGKNPEGREALKKRLINDPLGNKHILEDPFDVYWGHSSIIFAQHAGFFKLQDIGPCEYYINLSGADYPLLPFELIYKQLHMTGNLNWFDIIHDATDRISFMVRVILCL